MSVPRILAVLFFTNVLMAQQSAPPRFRIEPARPFDKERFAAALNLATGDHYHVVLYAGDALLERTEEDETYKYEAVEDSDAESLRRQLNEYGAKGYRVVGGLWGGMFPSRRLLMEKPPGGRISISTFSRAAIA